MASARAPSSARRCTVASMASMCWLPDDRPPPVIALSCRRPLLIRDRRKRPSHGFDRHRREVLHLLKWEKALHPNPDNRAVHDRSIAFLRRLPRANLRQGRDQRAKLPRGRRDSTSDKILDRQGELVLPPPIDRDAALRYLNAEIE
jgi:hypothetical protein